MKEIWTIIGVGLVLAGLILNQGWSLRADFNAGQSSLRAEFNAGQSNLRAEFKESQSNLRAEFKESQSSLRAEFKEGQSSLRAEFNASLSSLQAQIAELRDGQAELHRRVARIEGLLEGMLPSMAFIDPASLETDSDEEVP